MRALNKIEVKGMRGKAIRQKLLMLILTVFCVNAAGPGSARAAGEQSFSSWLGKLWPEAKTAGVSRATFDRVFSSLTPDCKLPGVYCPGETRKSSGRKLSERTGLPETCNKITQPEFLQPEKYFPPKYMRSLALKGRSILADLEAQGPKTHEHLMEIERSFRVPVNMLMGLWGRETAFGDGGGRSAVRAVLPARACRTAGGPRSVGLFRPVSRRRFVGGSRPAWLRAYSQSGHRPAW
jgi:membrane-bound lytic murein transglycosylase B